MKNIVLFSFLFLAITISFAQKKEYILQEGEPIGTMSFVLHTYGIRETDTLKVMRGRAGLLDFARKHITTESPEDFVNSIPQPIFKDIYSYYGLDVFKEHYNRYRTYNDTLRNTSMYKRIDRNTFDLTDIFYDSIENKYRKSSTTHKHRRNVATGRFLITEYRNDRKIIHGYDCFKVVLKNYNPNWVDFVMYVTEEIKLNYHPTIHFEEIISKYYPLEVMTGYEDKRAGHYTELTLTSIQLPK